MPGLTIALWMLLSVLPQGQAGREPQTPAECLKDVRGYVSRQYQAARAAGRTPNIAELDQEKVALARKYAARFPLETTAPGEIGALAGLYAEGKQLDRAQAAIDRGLAAPGRTPADNARMLLDVTRMLVSPSDAERTIPQAEAYLARIEAMGDDLVPQKIEGHGLLYGYYRYADIDEKIFAHAQRMVELGAKLDAAGRKVAGPYLLMAYTGLAEVHGDREEADQSLAILRRGLTELADVPRARGWLEPAIERYSLVGRPGAPLEAGYWLNAEKGPDRVELPGQVTLVQFTAHWCGPCRKSYPSMSRLHERFAKDGLRLMFATRFYGFFESRRSLKPEEELAADRSYFVEHYGLKFPVLVERAGSAETPGANGMSPNEARYFLGGVPQIVVTDKKGIVRLMMEGWDTANEERLSRLIARLLAEPGNP